MVFIKKKSKKFEKLDRRWNDLLDSFVNGGNAGAINSSSWQYHLPSIRENLRPSGNYTFAGLFVLLFMIAYTPVCFPRHQFPNVSHV